MSVPWFLEGVRMARRTRRHRDRVVIHYAKEGDLLPLIGLMRSGEELSPKVRSLVADLLEGKVKRPKHRPSKLEAWSDELGQLGRLLELESEGWKRTAAVKQVATEFFCSVRTVQTSLSDWKLNEIEAGCRHIKRIRELEMEGWERTAAVTQVATEFCCSERTVQTSVSKWEERHMERVLDLESEGWKRTEAVSQVATEVGCSERTVQTSLSRCKLKQIEKRRNRLKKRSPHLRK